MYRLSASASGSAVSITFLLCSGLAVAALALAPSPAVSGVVRVDQSGGGDYVTLSEGVAAAVAGDTVLVEPGTYTGPLNREIYVLSIHVESTGGPAATVIDCEEAGYAVALWSASLAGFTIRGATGAEESGYAAVLLRGGEVSDCVFEDNTRVGLRTYTTTAVADCVFLDHGECCMHIDPGATTVTRCVFENRTGPGVRAENYPYGSPRGEVVIADCTFRHNSSTALVEQESMISAVTGCLFIDNDACPVCLYDSSADFSYCTLVGNSTSSGVFALAHGYHGEQNRCTIEHCLVSHNRCGGIVTGVADLSSFDWNCFFANTCGDSLPGDVASSGNISEDPLFCDLGGGDVSLCENSPCLSWNEPIGYAMGAYAEAPGCGPCSSPVADVSWGAIKALYLPQ